MPSINAVAEFLHVRVIHPSSEFSGTCQIKDCGRLHLSVGIGGHGRGGHRFGLSAACRLSARGEQQRGKKRSFSVTSGLAPVGWGVIPFGGIVGHSSLKRAIDRTASPQSVLKCGSALRCDNL